MTVDDLEHFRTILTEKENNLADWLESADQATETDIAKVRGLLSDLQQALQRIETRTYGICKVCHDPVETHRLEVQPALEVCLGCITDEERQLLEEELSIASKIHRALLPQQIEAIDGYDLVVKVLVARSVGGDYFDVLRNDAGTQVKVIIADAMGKGIPAGLVMSNLQGALRVLAQESDSPARLAHRLNHWLCRNVPVTNFVSLACISLPIDERNTVTFSAANAGHCPGLILHANGEIEHIDPTGAVLGVHEDFDYLESVHQLSSGDLIALYTDGVTEAESAAGEQFETTRLINLLIANRTEPMQYVANRVLEEVQAFTGKQSPDDDFALILVRRK